MQSQTHGCRRPRWTRALASFALLAGLSLPLLASGEEEWGYELSHDLMSPFCPGRTLAACSSPEAAELRDWIIEQEVAGREEAAVREQLYTEYGDVLRSAPLASGGGEWAYVIPVVGFLLGGAIVFFFLRRQVRPYRPASAAEQPAELEGLDSELARIVDEDLSA